jgi:hypothetical protein
VSSSLPSSRGTNSRWVSVTGSTLATPERSPGRSFARGATMTA